MIVEERNYAFQPAHFRRFLALFEAEGIPLMKEHLGQLIGVFTAETGELNTVMQMWVYPDLAERERRRAAMWADPRWLAYADQVLPWIVRMETRLLKPTAFSPLR
ncbi:NIPSNAP family protein [Piscinibacter sp.]|uniref:NIPSNAP family protein n=1 Tax=Piscinibacter sp. TaxID=1903157 RepID=UPI0039E437A4